MLNSRAGHTRQLPRQSATALRSTNCVASRIIANSMKSKLEFDSVGQTLLEIIFLSFRESSKTAKQLKIGPPYYTVISWVHTVVCNTVDNTFFAVILTDLSTSKSLSILAQNFTLCYIRPKTLFKVFCFRKQKLLETIFANFFCLNEN